MLDLQSLKHYAETAFATTLEMPGAQPEGFVDWVSVSQVVAALARHFDWRVIGVSGSQGSGKSSLSATLAQTLSATGLHALTTSIDDFYLSHAARADLAEKIHPLLQTRGVPGTHDWQRLRDVLHNVQTGNATLVLPRFDKGLDDRIEDGPPTRADMLVLEGWCVGVSAQAEADLISPCNDLERLEDPQGAWRRWVNQQIAEHYEPLWRQVDFWVHLRVPSFAQVILWRSQQEQQLPADQQMSAAQIERFIQHYERLTRWMWQAQAKGPGVVIALDSSHRVANVTFFTAPQISS